MNRFRLFIAAVFGGLAVAIGAMGAHGLEDYFKEQGLDAAAIEKRIEQCEIAVRYHFYHTLALLGMAFLPATFSPKLVKAATFMMVVGLVLFSGGLYMLSFLGILGHWAIVPSGGMSWIVAWGLLGLAAIMPHKKKT